MADGLLAVKMLDLVDYMGVWDVASAHLGFKDGATNVPEIFVHEFVYEYNLTEYC